MRAARLHQKMSGLKRWWPRCVRSHRAQSPGSACVLQKWESSFWLLLLRTSICGGREVCDDIVLNPKALHVMQYWEESFTGSACWNTLALLICHIWYLILTFSQSRTLISCILYLGGVWGGHLLSPQPDQSKVVLKLLMQYLLTDLLYYTYLLDSYHMLVCTHKCMSGAIWSYLELSEAFWSYVELSRARWRFLELSGPI